MKARRIAQVVLFLVSAPVMLIALLFLSFQSSYVREQLAGQLSAQLEARTQIKLELTELRRLDPWGLDVLGLRVRTEDGGIDVRVDSISLHLRPLRLLRGEFYVDVLQIERVTGSYTHLTKVKDPAADKPATSSWLDSLELRVARLLLSESKVSLSGLGPYRGIAIPVLEASGAYGKRPWILLKRTELSVDAAQGRVLELHTDRSRWELEQGGAIQLSGKLGHATLRMEAALKPYEVGFVPGKASFEIRGFDSSDWVALGLEEPVLEGVLSVSGKLWSDGARLGADIVAHCAQSQIQVAAEFDGSLAEVKVHALSPNLRALEAALPEESVDARGEASFHIDRSPRPLRLAWSSAVYGEIRVPDGHAALELGEKVITLREFVLDDLGDALKAQGQWYTDTSSYGQVELTLQALQLARLSQLIGDASGRVDGEVWFKSGKDGSITGNAALAGKGLSTGSARISSLQLDAALSGSGQAPQLQFKATGDRLSTSEPLLDRITLDGSFEKGVLKAQTVANRDADVMKLTAQASGVGDPVIRWNMLGRGVVQTLPIHVRANGSYAVEPRAHALEAEFSAPDTQLTARAKLIDSGSLQADIQVAAKRLDRWSFAVAPHKLAGSAHAALLLSGEVDKLKAKLAFDAEQFRLDEQPALFASLTATASMPERNMEGRAALWTAKRDATLTLALKASHRGARNQLPPLDRIEHQAELHGELNLPLLTTYLGEKFEGLGGKVDVQARTQGPLLTPALHADIHARMKAPQEEAATDFAHVAVDVAPGTAKLYVRANEGKGPLLWLNAEVTLPTSSRGFNRDALPPFRVQGRVLPRQLNRMQGAWAFLTGVYQLDLPIEVGADIDLRGENELVNGKVLLNFKVMSDALDPACVVGARSDLNLGLDLADNEVSARIRATSSGGGTVDATAHTRLQLSKRQPGQPWTEDLEFEAFGRGIELTQLPGLCELQSGRGSFVLKAHHGASKPPEARLELGLERLKAPSGEPIDMSLVALMDPSGTQATGAFKVAARQVGTVEGRLPMAWSAESYAPNLDMQKPVNASVRLRSLPLGPFLAFGEALGRPKGTLSGEVRLAGSLDKPKPTADLTLEDIGFSIAALAQPLHGIRGRVILNDHNVKISGLTLRDRDGKVRIDGEGFLRADASGEAKLRIEATDFPLRRQGQVIGALTTAADVRASIDTNQGVRAGVEVDGGRLWLTGDKGRKTQSLKPNPDVRFVDLNEEEKAEETASGAIPFKLVDLRVSSSQGVWVMHRDFSVLVGLDVLLAHNERYVMTGAAKLQRGDLQLLGKTFRIEKGEVRLTGDFPPDPEIVLRAVYDTETGEDLYVSLSGRASAPLLAFSGAATNAGEAMAILSGAGRAGAESQAQTEARNFALGLTAGLLSVAIREELGEWVPVIIVENDDSGAIARGRAGFEASKLIPDFLRPIARGAYVEGIVGSTGQSGSSVGVGARLEVFLPYDFVTSTGYGPGPTWGADILWIP